MNDLPLLSLVTFLPLIGVLVILLIKDNDPAVAGDADDWFKQNAPR